MRTTLCPVLVGRDQEMQILEDLLARTCQGIGGLVVLLGPAGIGKSRLGREVAAHARARGMDAFIGRAVERETPPPLRPLFEALSSRFRRSAVPMNPQLQPYLPALGVLLPELAPAAPPAAREQMRTLLPEAVIRLLNAIGSSDGSLLVLEDLHWADGETLDVVEYLADNLESVPILCLVTLRTDQESPALELVDRLRTRRVAISLELEPLAPPTTARMIEAVFGTESLPAGLAQAVHTRSEGSPLLIEEIVADLVASRHLTASGASWEFHEPAESTAPAGFRHLVMRRIHPLGSTARDVLQAGAVLGRGFDWRLVVPMLRSTEEHVLAALGKAVEAQLVSARGSGLESTFWFRHSLIRQAILDDLLPPRRARLSGRAADAVEAAHPGLDGDWCELCAELRADAGEEDVAARLFVESGRRANQRGALAAAEAALDRARNLATDEMLTIEIEEIQLRVAASSGKTDRAIEQGTALLGRLAEAGLPSEREAAVHLGLARALLDTGSLPEAEAEIGLVWELTADGSLRAQAGAVAANIAAERRDADSALALANAALLEAEAAGLPEVACHSLAVIGRVQRSIDPGLSMAALERTATLAESRELPFWRLQALHELAITRHLQTGATDFGAEAREIALRLGALLTLAAIDLQSAVSLDTSQPKKALEHLGRCLETARRFRLRIFPFAMAVKAFIHAQLEEAQAMEEAAAVAMAAAPDDLDVLALIHSARGNLCLLREDRAGALRHQGLSMEQIRRSGLSNPLPLRGQWALLMTLEAEGGGDARAELAASPGALASGRNRGYLALAEAVVLGRRGRRREAEELYGKAEPLLATEPFELHLARRLTAEAAIDGGWGEPQAWLREAMAYFRGNGHQRISHACGKMLRATGARLPRAGRGYSVVPAELMALGVTSREVDVLKLLAEGLSNREVAARLYISENTVETHVANLLSKTGTTSRTQLIARHSLRHSGA